MKSKLCMKATNYVCFELEEETTEGVENNKRNFISVIGDKFAMSIKRGKTTISYK